LNRFAEVMNVIAKEAIENPEVVLAAPSTAPTKRLDEALANRKLNLKWGDELP